MTSILTFILTAVDMVSQLAREAETAGARVELEIVATAQMVADLEGRLRGAEAATLAAQLQSEASERRARQARGTPHESLSPKP